MSDATHGRDNQDRLRARTAKFLRENPRHDGPLGSERDIGPALAKRYAAISKAQAKQLAKVLPEAVRALNVVPPKRVKYICELCGERNIHVTEEKRCEDVLACEDRSVTWHL